ncbi:phage tail sheath subtilisin-like domain-containing protein [Metasolibacillus meyeri]|uniref:Phage tail sheath subtilisin-like domain-containing protein n=1 Tax=Metasolibacillus meyeri TaxID=1071052 RepID=A0AAW9NUM8_9BACL|nr:phage tail sheath subtilisin-like domain-containing protein [Metasolibacillus meyeri]MEC1178541.1 phage tail sheath subtilisin-like domain-containing protein [Metasolibacillus meyeri]
MGGIWETQNKVRPDAYINFESNSLNTMGLDSNGALAIPVVLNWGEVGKFIKLSTNTKFKSLFGKSLAEILPVREAFKATSNIYLYNLNGVGEKAKATVEEFTVTAAYGGSDGNKIHVTVTVGLDNTATIKTFFDAMQVDSQKVESFEELKVNDYVEFSGSFPNTDVTLTLAGGTTVAATNESISEFASALDALDFKTVAYGTDDNTIKSLLALKAKEFREQAGKRVTFVTNNYNAADHESTVSVKNGVTLDGGEVLTAKEAVYWFAAVFAASTVNSLTYATYPGAIAVETMTNDEIIQALKEGHIVYSFNNNEVVVEQDINTFRSFTPAKNQDFRKGKIDRGMSIIENNTRHIFRKYFIGKVNNNGDGRDLFKQQIMKSVLDPYVRLGVINPYLPEDVVIEQGDEKDAVFAVLGLEFIDAMEKLYMRVECK